MWSFVARALPGADLKTRAAASGVGRKRDRLLLDALLREAPLANGQLTAEVCLRALNAVWGRPVRDPKEALAIIQKKLQNPNFRAGLAAQYDVTMTEAGFTLVDAAKKHVEHIRGIEYEKVIIVRDNKDSAHVEVVKVRGKPSYAALRGYWDLTLPELRK